MVVFHRSELPLEAFPLMEDIRRRGKLCDVTLKVRKHFGDFDFLLHRIRTVSCISKSTVNFIDFQSSFLPVNASLPFLEVKDKCFYVYVYKMGVHWYFR